MDVQKPVPRWSLGEPGFAERYRAIGARDVRFDGQFFTAVTSTGIYCRPSCPARTPQPRNVVFFLTSAAAHEAGFRACRRCLPEATPGTREWDLRGDVAGRAMRLIVDGVVDREGVDGLARRVGYSARHLQRVLVAELGAGALALSRARRAQTARALLVESDVPLAQVAFASGFGSVRQFNDTMRDVFASPPSELRSRRRTCPESIGDATRLEIDLPVRQPFDAPGIFRFLAQRAVAGVETTDLSVTNRLRYARTLTLPHGPGAAEVVARSTDSGQWQMRARLELADLADLVPAIARIRRLFDLDADPIAVDTALAFDPALAPLVARTPGIRLPGTSDPHELVVRALVGQQISVQAARTHLARLAAALGAPYASSFAGIERVFPTSAQLASALGSHAAGDPLDPDRPLRLPSRAVQAIAAAARDLDDATLRIDVGVDAAELRAELLARPRFGPWTAGYVAMRVLGDPDVWPGGDVALLAGARAAGIVDGAGSRNVAQRTLVARAQRWSPWRSYAAMHLWQAAEFASRKDSR